jgi:selenium-binding protein 1
MAQIDVLPGGGIKVNADFHVEFPGYRAHQVRLEGGDSSTDSFCFTA